MRRRYTTSDYRSLLEYIKTIDADAGIGADVLVGFPGESEALFNETANFISELPLSYLHVFTYSEREKTDAIMYEGRVEPRVRHERNTILRTLSMKKRHQFASSFLGTTLPVLFEHENEKGISTGLTTNYLRIETPTSSPLTNNIQPVFLRNIVGEVCNGILQEKYS
ncbi:MAG: hypothetical protein EPO24_03630 [Bacteroidetes bacterium]|nr:MAG: hypothetical protein EPO24_03630 [Bacteroidota bacterium]